MARGTSKGALKNFLLVTTTLLAVSYFAIDYLPKLNNKVLTSTNNLNEAEVKKIAQVVVENYIKDNPQAILTSLENMQKNEFEKRTEEASVLIKNSFKELQDVSHTPFYGQKIKPRHVVIHFYDYLCGYCMKAAEVINDIVTKHGHDTLIVYRDLPILGEASMNIAKVAGAVAKYNPENYYKFYNAMFKSSNKSIENVKKLAIEYGVDKDNIENYLQSQEAQEYIQRSHDIAKKIKVMGTPYIVIDEKLYNGNLNYNDIKELLK